MTHPATPQIVLLFAGACAAQDRVRLLQVVRDLYARQWMVALDPEADVALVEALVQADLPFATFGVHHEEEMGHLGPSHVPEGEYDPMSHLLALARLIAHAGAGLIYTDGNAGCHGHWLSVYLSTNRKPSVRVGADRSLSGLVPGGWAPVKTDRKIQRNMGYDGVVPFLLGVPA